MSARPLSRAAVVAVVGLSALVLGTSPAGATPGLTIALDPPQVEVYLTPVENYDLDALLDEDSDLDDWFTPVDVEWGGGLVVQLPAGIDGSDADWTLETGSETDEEPTRTLSTDADGVDHLDVTDQDDGAYRVALPTDDGTSGPVGLLTVDGLTGTDEDVELLDSLYYLLEFTGSGSSVATVAPQATALSSVPCALELLGSSTDCPPYPTTAGGAVSFTVPEHSPLRSLGFGRLPDMDAVLADVSFGGYEDGEYESTEYDEGYDEGYDAGYSAEYDGDCGENYFLSYGTSYVGGGEGHDAGYTAGTEDGRADGMADAEADPVCSDGPSWAAATVEALPDGLPGAGRSADVRTPAAAMARVAEVLRAVHDATDGNGSFPAEPAPVQPASAAAASTVPDGVSAAAVETADPVEPADAPVAEEGAAWSGLSVTVESSSDGVLPVSATASGATVTIPADTEPGAYALILSEGTDLSGPSSAVFVVLDVAAADAAAVEPTAAAPTAAQDTAAPVLNRGLRSETGWREPASSAVAWPLVVLGAGTVLVAGASAAVVIRPRRRPSGE